MTAPAATLATCGYCQTDVPLSSTYEPFLGNGAVRRCRDAVACQNRQLYAGTGIPAGPAVQEAQALSAPSPGIGPYNWRPSRRFYDGGAVPTS